jgi:hypothetical protein
MINGDSILMGSDQADLDAPELTTFSYLRTSPLPLPDGVTADGDPKSMLMLCISDNIELFRRTLTEASNTNGFALLELRESDDGTTECAVSVCVIVEKNPQGLTGTDALAESQCKAFAAAVKATSTLRRVVSSRGGISDMIDELMSFPDDTPAKFAVIDKLEYGTLYPVIVSTLFWQDGSPLGSTEVFDIRFPELPCHAPIKARKKSTPVQSEADMEKELRNWLIGNGFAVEQQVASFGVRYDLWLPNRAFVELKRSRITGNDICQVIGYLSKTDLLFILVGQSIGVQQSQAIESINQLLGDARIVFVQWSCAKDILPSLLTMGCDKHGK